MFLEDFVVILCRYRKNFFYPFLKFIYGVVSFICLRLFVHISTMMVYINPLTFNFVVTLWKCMYNLNDFRFYKQIVYERVYNSL